jgi:hypothetical protein
MIADLVAMPIAADDLTGEIIRSAGGLALTRPTPRAKCGDGPELETPAPGSRG